MELKLYGMAMSLCTQRVLVCAKQLNIPVELVPVDLMTGEHKTPEFLNKHPFAAVPYLVRLFSIFYSCSTSNLFLFQDDDGFILFESRAIARYLSAAYADGKLIPKGLKENALFEQAVSIENNNFQPDAYAMVFERVFA